EIHSKFRYLSTINDIKTRIQKMFWFTTVKDNEPVDLKTDPEYSGRVQYQCENNDCTLRISDLRESDSAEYKFMLITNDPGGKYTGSPGVTLTVTVFLQSPLVSGPVTVGVRARLPVQGVTMILGNDLANGKVFPIPEVVENPVDDFVFVSEPAADSLPSVFPACIVTRAHKRKYSDVELSDFFLYAPKLPSVSVSPSAEIVEGSSVNLTCSSDANPAASYTWYKEDVINPLRDQKQHFFSSILPSDSGKYYCTADNDLGQKRSESRNIDVKYPPKLPSVSVSPSAEIVEGSSVTLTCSSDANPAAKYTWYKEDEDSPKASGHNFTISNIRPEHSGSYYCVAHNSRGRHNVTLHLTAAESGCIVLVLLVSRQSIHIYTEQHLALLFTAGLM
uniref:B-cell receptor CD22 n=1 Tax=Pundamilia nyererei TaxID=303518 RepID=A0A3B4GI21_9CICH